MKKLELDFFNDLAAKFGNFEEFSDEQYNEYISRLVNETEIRLTDTILELGCGTGAFTSRILPLGYKIIGLDISDKMLSKAKKNSESYYIQADMERLPFSNNNFDVVFSSASLHHLSNLSPGISEIFRVLKKGGRFFSIDPNGLNPLSWAEIKVPFIRNLICKK